MRELELIYPLIMPFAPGVADPTMDSWIRQAAIDFCERTRLWRYEDELTITANEAEAMMSPIGSVVFEIERAYFNDRELEPVSTAWLDERMPQWRTGEYESDSRYVTQTEPNTIQLVPAAAGNVRLYLWLKPSQDAQDLPDFIVDKYREMIAWGALARILMIPNQSFSNPQMATYWQTRFDTKLDSLFLKGAKGEQRAPMRTKSSFF